MVNASNNSNNNNISDNDIKTSKILAKTNC